MEEEKEKAELYAALAQFQGKFKNPEKKSSNPFFKSKYADLSGVWEAIRSDLSLCGLAFIQMPNAGEGVITVRGIIAHKSGATVESELTLKPKDMTPQAIGSAITYARRYQLCAMLGIAPADEDDDANEAQGNKDREPEPKTVTKLCASKEKQQNVTAGDIVQDYVVRAFKRGGDVFSELTDVISQFTLAIKKDYGWSILGENIDINHNLTAKELDGLVAHIETYYKSKRSA